MAEFKEELVINALHADKAVVGKKYWCADEISRLKYNVENNSSFVGELNEKCSGFFKINYFPYFLIYPYEEPKYRPYESTEYRPYESTDEMVEDFCKRAGFEPTSMLMPSIWLREKGSTAKRLVIGLVVDYVYLQFSSEINNYWTLSELFNEFTYLDGSPVGKEK